MKFLSKVFLIGLTLPLLVFGGPDLKSHAVFGASGDIGAALVSYIDMQGAFVRGVFRSQASIESYLQRANHSLRKEQYLIIEKFLHQKELESVLKDNDVFYLLAAALGLDKVPESGYKNLAINGLMPIKIIQVAERVHRDIRFVYGSSYVVHNLEEEAAVASWLEKALHFIATDRVGIEKAETEEELISLSRRFLQQAPYPEGIPAYAVAKFFVDSYLTTSKLTNFISVRIANSYGAGSLSGRTMQRLIETQLKNGEMAVHQESRDYIHLKDLAAILYQAGTSDILPRNSFIDAASGYLVPMKEIWNMIAEYTPDCHGRVKFLGPPSCQTLLEAQRSRKLLGRDFIPFAEGLKEQVEWMEKLHL